MISIISKYRYVVLSLALTSTLALTLASCADWDDWKYNAEKPETIAQYEYLDDYKPLKEYQPGFKVSGALSATDFSEKGQLFRLAAHNFDEIVAGNAMKMGSCVSSTGAMDFSTVQSLLTSAEDADVSVYGHCLAWHSQQPVKYLSSLIADKEVPGGSKVGYIAYTSTAGTNQWDNEAIYTLPVAMEKGADYVLTMKAKATDNCQVGFWPIWNASPNKNQWGGSNDVQYLDQQAVGTSWTDLTWEFNANFPLDVLQFTFGKFGGELRFTDISLVKKGTETNLVKNPKFEEESVSGWSSNWNGPSYAYGQEGGAKLNYFIKFTSTQAGSNKWDYEAIYTLPKALTKGKTYTLTADIRAAENYSIGFWPIWNASPNKNQWGGSNDVQYEEDKTVTTKWTTVTWEFTANYPLDVLQFVFGTHSGDMCFDNLVLTESGSDENLIDNGTFDTGSDTGWSVNWNGPTKSIGTESQSSIPLTDKEKKDILTTVMNAWCKAMIMVTGGYVKAWDLINEPVCQNGNFMKDGYYHLQGAKYSGSDDSWDVGGDKFYWQDYLGEEDYGPIVEKAARQAYAEVEGTTPSDLKLFVNDYNLESDWDQNLKLKSLIHWVEIWEQKGAKIDGLGTQMHISYDENETKMASKKAAIQNMFRLMAETGKLVRISELDMGYIDKNGKNVTTAEMTEISETHPLSKRIEQEKAMGDFYQWIIEQYRTIVPAAQQYGICQWCLTDSPADSSWRGGQPVGLWNQSYQRKPAYGGWAEGLKK